MNPDRGAAVGRLAELVVGVERSHPLRVAIDGLNGAGTTTLSDDLARAVRSRGRRCLRVSLAGFRRPGPGRSEPPDESDAFDLPMLRTALLEPLGPGGDRRYRTALSDPAAKMAPPGTVVLVDGCYLLGEELEGCWDFRVWVECEEETARARAVGRDRGSFGPDIDRRYRERDMPTQRAYLDAVDPAPKADVRFVNNDPDHPVLVVRR